MNGLKVKINEKRYLEIETIGFNGGSSTVELTVSTYGNTLKMNVMRFEEDINPGSIKKTCEANVERIYSPLN